MKGNTAVEEKLEILQVQSLKLLINDRYQVQSMNSAIWSIRGSEILRKLLQEKNNHIGRLITDSELLSCHQQTAIWTQQLLYRPLLLDIKNFPNAYDTPANSDSRLTVFYSATRVHQHLHFFTALDWTKHDCPILILTADTPRQETIIVQSGHFKLLCLIFLYILTQLMAGHFPNPYQFLNISHYVQSILQLNADCICSFIRHCTSISSYHST